MDLVRCGEELKSWIVSALEREHHQKPTIVKIVPLHIALGHMSEILRLHLEWSNSTKNLPKTVIAKIPGSKKSEESLDHSCNSTKGIATLSTKSGEGEVIVKMMHKIEMETYALLKETKCDGLAVPYLYDSLPLSSPTPCLLMEDIHSSHMIDLIDGFNDEQLYQIVDQLVAFHIYCFTHENWKSCGFEDKVNSNYWTYVAMINDMGKQLMAEYPLLKNGLTLLLEKYTASGLWYIEHLQYYRKNDVIRTYVHGDLWAANILWRDGKLAAIVDWTLCHPGPLTEDLQRLLVTSCTVETRKRMTRPLLKYYFENVQRKMSEIRKEMPFSFKDLEDDYHRTLPYTCVQTLFAVGFWWHTPIVQKGKKIRSRSQNE
ncbi:hypothetical protein KIN20_003470 [Parelaphostrongylus tenuis]|uniref:CHK kinase-like domain-containing protein n=1 Tax=Parelaphostrongylus tenuis TaxID=148309 RepID=A0AAD5LZ73_PARTN|nr:hypothetical protein KIN20_003470 [Parelaphostrongylus tenuis]